MKLYIALGMAMAVSAAADVYVPPLVTVHGQREPQALCDHPIYCNGPILDTVMSSGVFDEDKSFVDMPTRKPVAAVVAAFNALPKNATASHVAQFVDENFHPAGYDVVPAELDDWTDDPPFLHGVTDPILRGYGMSVHSQWKKLARRHDPSRLCTNCTSSLLSTNHTFIVPGSNTSREFGYWNSYYINSGLLKSGLYKTAKGVLRDLLNTVRTYGFVPTGGRVYYTDRSGLPLLPLMVKDYYEATKDLTFVAEALPLLVKELEFWDTHRSVNVSYTPNSATLSKRQQTSVSSKITLLGPNLFSTASSQSSDFVRPESFLADTETSKIKLASPNLFSTASTGSALYAASEAGTTPSVQYANRTAAEIGPSLFSTAVSRRALNIPTTNPFSAFSRDQLLVLGSVDINDTVAVNINSILYQSEIAISLFYELLHNGTQTTESRMYRSRAGTRRQTLIDLAYNPQTGLFADYHVRSGTHADVWSINSLWSFWAFSDTMPIESAHKGLQSLQELHEKFPGGLPNTYYNTTLLWDWPNVQSPMQHMAIRSAASIESHPQYRKRNGMGSVAAGIAQSTLGSAFCNWYTTGGSIDGVLNSYDQAKGNSSGSSFGSYVIGADGQITTTTDTNKDPGNYAWTNGVLLYIFDQYKPEIKIPTCPNIKLNIVDHSTPPPPTPTPTYSPPPPSPTLLPPTPTSCTAKRRCTNCKCRMKRRGLSKRSDPVHR
ncbi:hypothetical protein IWW46_004712 [Coemansia sp. RSA 2440]|nr:hypothetical protein IWW46_004712 [Coemansia sp. RSA 2440]